MVKFVNREVQKWFFTKMRPQLELPARPVTHESALKRAQGKITLYDLVKNIKPGTRVKVSVHTPKRQLEIEGIASYGIQRVRGLVLVVKLDNEAKSKNISLEDKGLSRYSSYSHFEIKNKEDKEFTLIAIGKSHANIMTTTIEVVAKIPEPEPVTIIRQPKPSLPDVTFHYMGA